jgi:uncharacterized membrane protein YczE
MSNLSWLKLAKLFFGLFFYGAGLAVMLHAGIGLSPWDVLGQGVSKTLHISYGMAQIAISAIVLLCWIPIRQKPGFGTLMNAVFIGVFADLVLGWLQNAPLSDFYLWNLLTFFVGMVLMALATGLYISADLGMGPRDGLAVGTARKGEWKLWKVRTVIELVVLGVGAALGGQVREGTVIFALCIGFLMQRSLRLFGVKGHKRPIEEA